ncbi:hypothetical protein MMPV_008864 [Pyropia vietnamensis]
MARRTPSTAATTVAALVAAVAVVLCGPAAPVRVTAAVVLPRVTSLTSATEVAGASGGRTASVDSDQGTNTTLPLVVRRLRSWPPTGSAGVATAAVIDASDSVDTDLDTNSTLPLLV